MHPFYTHDNCTGEAGSLCGGVTFSPCSVYGLRETMFSGPRQKQIETWERNTKRSSKQRGGRRSEERRLNSPTMAAPAAHLFPPHPHSPPPATQNRESRSEERVHHWHHVSWFVNDEVVHVLQTSNSCLLLFKDGKDGWCSFKQSSCLQRRWNYIQILCDGSGNSNCISLY